MFLLKDKENEKLTRNAAYEWGWNIKIDNILTFSKNDEF